jgi:hypothetical protein
MEYSSSQIFGIVPRILHGSVVRATDSNGKCSALRRNLLFRVRLWTRNSKI